MAETAAHLVDRVIPHVPVRQWVLTFPFPVRYVLAYDPALCSSVRRIFLRAVLGFLERRARRAGFPDARGGAVVYAQRLGSALNLNLHFHALVLDGVFVDHDGTPVFHEAPPLTDEDVARLTKTLHDRVLRHLRRAGRLYDPEHPEAGEAVNAEPDEPLLAALAAASAEGPLGAGFHPRARAPRAANREDLRVGSSHAAHAGFTLQAHVRIAADRRDQLERLCRYIARPPIASERLIRAPDGRVVLELRRAFRDGTTHILFDPLTFLERLAALIPRPRVHLFTYHGVLAPAAKWREQVIPEPPVEEDTDDERESRGPAGSPQDTARASRWAQLMKRVFEIDVLICEHCGGRREILAVLTETRVVQKILAHLGLPTEPPPIAPARSPPEPTPLFA